MMGYNMLTPVHKVGNVWVKRDDLFEIAGVKGGKVRTAWALSQGAKGLVTAGARTSPQCVIVARIARHLGIPCHCHMPWGEVLLQGKLVREAGASVIQHKPGYNSVLIHRAHLDALETGWTEIPFGMDCTEAVKQTSEQVKNLPFDDFDRLVVPVGSGMSLAGVLHGIRKYDVQPFTRRVLGVQVGADPTRRLNTNAPMMWRSQCSIIKSELKYDQEAKDCFLGSIYCDPIYEAKCLPYLKAGDLFWIVGLREVE